MESILSAHGITEAIMHYGHHFGDLSWIMVHYCSLNLLNIGFAMHILPVACAIIGGIKSMTSNMTTDSQDDRVEWNGETDFLRRSHDSRGGGGGGGHSWMVCVPSCSQKRGRLFFGPKKEIP